MRYLISSILRMRFGRFAVLPAAVAVDPARCGGVRLGFFHDFPKVFYFAGR
jgi:hypothetical protein